jgi:hypothetical protein
MKKILHASIGKTAVLSLLLLISLGLAGCAGVGRVVPADDRILFGEKGTGQGSYSRGGLTVTYSYRLTDGKIILDGQAHYIWAVESLDVRLLFLDAAGTVLQRKLVYSSGYRVARSWMTERTFQKTMVVPSGAVGISFSYFEQLRRGNR